jgi:hypothetical protein
LRFLELRRARLNRTQAPTNVVDECLDLGLRFMREREPEWVVMRPTALSSFGRLVMASSLVFRSASRTYQDHQL